jgi:hypothetical protein
MERIELSEITCYLLTGSHDINFVNRTCNISTVVIDFHGQFVGSLMIYIHEMLHILSSNGPLLVIVEIKAKIIHRTTVAVLIHTLQKNCLRKFLFSKNLEKHIS